MEGDGRAGTQDQADRGLGRRRSSTPCPIAPRREDAKTVRAMMERLTGEPAGMWGPSIIGFGTYHYKYDSGHEGDMCRLGFSPRKAELVLYVLTESERAGRAARPARQAQDRQVVPLHQAAERRGPGRARGADRPRARLYAREISGRGVSARSRRVRLVSAPASAFGGETRRARGEFARSRSCVLPQMWHATKVADEVP